MLSQRTETGVDSRISGTAWHLLLPCTLIFLEISTNRFPGHIEFDDIMGEDRQAHPGDLCPHHRERRAGAVHIRVGQHAVLDQREAGALPRARGPRRRAVVAHVMRSHVTSCHLM